MKSFPELQVLLDKNRGKITSSKGGWRIGEAVYNHGFSMMDDLVGKVSYFQVMMLNVTGKLYPLNVTQWLEASYICMSWPDPRIWCNYIGALAGSARTSPAAGVLAGTLASDSKMYGPGSLPNCMRVIRSANSQRSEGVSCEEIVDKAKRGLNGKPVLAGYARPVAKGDERVIAMRKVSRTLGFAVGEHERTAKELESYLLEHFDESLNIGGYTAAFLADQGLSVTHMYQITSTRVTAGVQACFAEAADRPAGCFLPLRCNDIEYHGSKIRPVL